MNVTLKFGILLLILSQILEGDPNKIAIHGSISSSPSIGVTYHLTDNFALRSSINFKRSVREVNFRVFIDSTYATEKDEIKDTSYGGSLSGLFYLKSKDQLRIYFGSTFSGKRSLYENPIYGTDRTSLYKSWIFGYKSFVGFQISINNRLSVFSEIGAKYDINTGNRFADNSTYYSFSVYSSGIGP